MLDKHVSISTLTKFRLFTQFSAASEKETGTGRTGPVSDIFGKRIPNAHQ